MCDEIFGNSSINIIYFVSTRQNDCFFLKFKFLHLLLYIMSVCLSLSFHVSKVHATTLIVGTRKFFNPCSSIPPYTPIYIYIFLQHEHCRHHHDNQTTHAAYNIMMMIQDIRRNSSSRILSKCGSIIIRILHGIYRWWLLFLLCFING